DVHAAPLRFEERRMRVAGPEYGQRRPGEKRDEGREQPTLGSAEDDPAASDQRGRSEREQRERRQPPSPREEPAGRDAVRREHRETDQRREPAGQEAGDVGPR